MGLEVLSYRRGVVPLDVVVVDGEADQLQEQVHALAVAQCPVSAAPPGSQQRPRPQQGARAGAGRHLPLGISLVGMSLTESVAAPEVGVAPPIPDIDGDHERMTHIVLEGVDTEEGDFVAAGPTVAEGIVMGTPVRALCGKVWVPGRDPKRYPLCPTCKEIAQQMGWSVPAS